MPGLGGEAMAGVCATVMNLPGSELAEAFAPSTVNRVEWNRSNGEASMGFWRFGKYNYALGWHEPATSLDLSVNSAAWDGMPADLQAVVEQCIASANLFALSESTAYSAPQLQKLVNEHGSIVTRVRDDALAALENVVGEMISYQAANDPMSKKVPNSLPKFRSELIEYSNTTEADFMRARNPRYCFPTSV